MKKIMQTLSDKYNKIPKNVIYISLIVLSYFVLYFIFSNNKQFVEDNFTDKNIYKIDSLNNVIDSLDKNIIYLNNKISLLEYKDSLINKDIDTLNYNDKILENKINNNIKEKNEKNIYYLNNASIDSVYMFISKH